MHDALVIALRQTHNGRVHRVTYRNVDEMTTEIVKRHPVNENQHMMLIDLTSPAWSICVLVQLNVPSGHPVFFSIGQVTISITSNYIPFPVSQTA